MRVYPQVFRARMLARGGLRDLLGAPGLRTETGLGPETTADASDATGSIKRQAASSAAYGGAAEGIRTLDLCMASSRWGADFHTNMPANKRFSRHRGSRTLPGIYREITGVWVANG
jgi:hypothetical protein